MAVDGAPRRGWSGYFCDDLGRLPSRLRQRVFMTKTRAEMEASAAAQSKHSLLKVLGPWLLTVICLGQIIGAGIFVLTGTAAKNSAGPAVVISYVISAILAFFSALTFVEMACDYPLAGASFNYCLAVLGEFPAFIAVVATVVDGFLAGGAVARSWSSYLAVLCGKPSAFFKIHHGGYDLDLVAFGITLVITAIVAYGTRESAIFNFIFKGTNILLIVVILCLAYPHANPQNITDFFPYKDHGVFAGAAVVFFAYNGYNAACNMAEEAKNPSRDLPIAILGSLSVATVLYLLMALAITMMVPYKLIDVGAPFSAAFLRIPGWHWVAYLVSVGAVFGLGTVLLIQVMVITREFLVMSRHNLVPGWFAYVNPHTGTPLRIVIPFGIAKAILALCTSFDTLAKLVNCGILFVAALVASSVLLRRYLPAVGSGQKRAPVLIRYWVVVACSIAFAGCYKGNVKWYSLVVIAAVWIATFLSFYALPQVFTPSIFAVPAAPVICSCAIFGAFFLIASLGPQAVWRFSIVLGIMTFLYLVYGVHASAHHDEDMAALHAKQTHEEKLEAVEAGPPAIPKAP